MYFAALCSPLVFMGMEKSIGIGNYSQKNMDREKWEGNECG
jgi:hypothetical protein